MRASLVLSTASASRTGPEHCRQAPLGFLIGQLMVTWSERVNSFSGGPLVLIQIYSSHAKLLDGEVIKRMVRHYY